MKFAKFVSLLLLFSPMIARSQTNVDSSASVLFFESNSGDTFLVSTYPTTNRDYLIYLMWIYNVYGSDFPENIVQAIPGTISLNPNDLADEFVGAENPFEIIFNYCQPFVQEYMFDPVYLDYPCIGLSWLQANKFCKWLSDRYNENKLIKLGYYEHNLNQIAGDCFVLESYLKEQYYGARQVEEVPMWTDQVFIPTFRLPTSGELLRASSHRLFSEDFRNHPYDTTSFLDFWNKSYLKATRESLELFYNTYSNESEIFYSTKDSLWSMDSSQIEEMTLDIERDTNASAVQILNGLGQKTTRLGAYDIEKDSLGQMPFVVIGEDDENQPIIVETFKQHELPAANSYSFFRYAGDINPRRFIH